MRTLTYVVATTLDGFIAGTDGTDPTGNLFDVGQDYLEHVVAHYPETLPTAAREALGVSDPGTRFDTVLEGRRSYQVGLDAGVADAYEHLRHLVVTTTLEQTRGTAVELVRADPVARVRELKAEPSDTGRGIWLVGGATLAASLYGEIDEVVLKVNPVAAGAGIPLFAGLTTSDPRRFRLTDQAVLASGVVVLTYAVPGARR